MDTVYNERKKRNVSMSQLHDLILGTEKWDVFTPLTEFFSSSSTESVNSGSTTEQANSSMTDISGFKQFPCSLNNAPDIEDTAGILLSPGFPHDYPNGYDCSWNLNVPIGTNLTIQFWAFDIEVR